MIKLLTIFAIAMAILLIVTAPYIAAVLYATVSILQPHYVWFWAFEGFSIFKISAGIAIVAWFVQMIRGQINWQVYNNGIFYGMCIIGCLYYVSDALSPFPNYSSMVGSSIVMDVYTTMLIMSFVTLGLINNKTALKLLIITLLFATVYYTYWANSAYLASDWSQFTSGRLDGPLGSPYRDGNIFSILFVIGLPFLLFAIYQTDKKWQQILIIICIPFLWHALILCASRGALLSAGVSTLLVAWMIKSKTFNVVLIAGFFVFIVDQGGELLARTTETVRLAETRAEEPLDPRLVAWEMGIELIKKHPILGVGPQRFLEASAFYAPGKTPHVAHNTFLNFAANTGLITGIIYLSYLWNKKALEKHPDKLHAYVNKASICSLVAFFIGALFLDLIIFEPFYFLLLIIVLNHFLLKQKIAATIAVENKTDNPNRPNLTGYRKSKVLTT